MIYSITKFTTTDYPDHISAVIWFSGCNMRCLYCYNPSIVLDKGKISKEQLFHFLKSRQGKLDAIVFSGGECTLQEEFVDLCKEVKKLNFKLKIDTNGSNPEKIKEALPYIDYIALDFKGLRNFKEITKSNLLDKFKETLNLLILSKVPFEVRTTVHSSLLKREDIEAMEFWLREQGYKGEYYIQNYLNVETLGGLTEQDEIVDLNGLNVIKRNF